jgi:hypothetical protein
MMIQQTMEVPQSRHLDVSLPETFAPGTQVVFIERHLTPQKRVGFFQRRLSLPEDFDRMGQDDIAALFEGAQ